VAHPANSTVLKMREFFGYCIISSKSCPSRSPDLTPLDFCHWTFIVVEELKQNIQLCISRITEKTLHRVA